MILDVAIVGSGPAALTAALYAARAGLKTVVYERAIVGGLTATISEIENYPGYTGGNGGDLVAKIEEQAVKFGAEVEYGECTKIEKTGNRFTLTIDDEPVQAWTVIVAVGSEPRKLGITGEESAGIHYCATCDGAFYKSKEVVVIGGGNSAVQESFYLLQFAKSVTIVSRSPLKADKHLVEKLATEPRIKTIIGKAPVDFVVKDGRATALRIAPNTPTPKKTSVSADGFFVQIGYNPATKFLEGSGVELSDYGYIKTDRNCATNIKGLFAAGDVVDGVFRQSIIAAGNGATAALSASDLLLHR